MKSESYRYLAGHYDILNSEVDYAGWSEFIDGVFKEHKIARDAIILDAGCGTANITVRLAQKGYDMIGVDISPEMLALARKRAQDGDVDILFICRDMSEIELYGTVSGAISCLDSVNYLDSASKLDSFLSLMHNYIEKGGVLLFDVNTKEKFERVYKDNHYILEDEGVLCAWQNSYSPKSRLCTFYLSIFEEERDGLYRRYDEVQRQRYYPTSTIKRLLQKNGFEIEDIVSDFDKNKAQKQDLRHFYICKRI